mmetsp:Transcript_22915/g.54843  ORF Transcript_22915/g.54843 Transcript_22915/m.54843 type:complete len:278 (+) Transcript_22915:282-1115(+)
MHEAEPQHPLLSRYREGLRGLERGDAKEFGVRVLLAHGLQRVGLGLPEHGVHLRDAPAQLLSTEAGYLLEEGRPRRQPHGVQREAECGGGDLRGSVLEERVLLERQLAQVLAKRLGRSVALASLCRLHEAVQEALGGGDGQLEVQSVQDDGLHGHDLFPLVRIVRDVDKLVDGRWMNFLVFGGNQHASDAHELQLAAGDWYVREEAVDVVDGQVQRLRDESVLLRHLHQPVDQNSSHLGVDVALVLHEVWGDLLLADFQLLQVSVDLVHVVVAVLRI